MLNIEIPLRHYNTGDYPNLEAGQNRADAAPIPIGGGEIARIVPVCIDTVAQTFKMVDHAIHAVPAVRAAEAALVLGTDYTVDLANGEITITSTPLIEANKTYYFKIESDITIDGVNYLVFEVNQGHYHPLSGAEFNGERLWYIDGGGVWSEQGIGFYFDVYGKTSLDALGEDVLVQRYSKNYFQKTDHWNWGAYLRMAAAQTAIAQQFTTPATGGPWYVTRIKIGMGVAGVPDPARITTIAILDAARAQVGAKSITYDLPGGGGNFPQRGQAEDLEVDIEAAEVGGAMIDQLSDWLTFLVVDVLKKSSALLDATYLANLAANRTQAIKAYVDNEMTVGAHVGKLEAGQLWKLIELLDGTLAAVVYEAGEPANTPHFEDYQNSRGELVYSDFLSFRMWYDFSSVRQKVRVLYDEDAKTGDFKAEEVTSDYARFFYSNEETLEIETYHKTQPGAAWCGAKYSAMYERPPLMVEFEVHGYGLELIPARDKTKLTRARAMYAGGVLPAVLFRIQDLQKRPGTSTTVFTAQLDIQTY